MSIETDFRTALLAHAPLTALIGDRVSQDAAPDGSLYPLVVFAVRRDTVNALDGTPLIDQASISVQCWGETGASAEAVADAVRGALADQVLPHGALQLDRATATDTELDLDAVILTVQWWGSP